MVECAHHQGCRSLVPYHKLQEHEITCRYNACLCTETDCHFAAAPPQLVAHLEAVHSIKVHSIAYGDTKVLTEMVPLACSADVAMRRVIIVGENDGTVFVLTFGAVEHFTLVSAVCVRRKECESPVYRVRTWADIPYRFNGFGRDGRKNIASVDLEASSSNKPSDIGVSGCHVLITWRCRRATWYTIFFKDNQLVATHLLSPFASTVLRMQAPVKF